MVQCCVPFCKSTPGPKVPYSFHEFPVTKIRLEWIRRISRKSNGPTNELWQPSDRSKVCSLHFREEDFRRDLKMRRLLPNAVPSIFPGYPAAMQEARRLSPLRESENQAPSSTPQLLTKRLRHEGSGPKRRAPKKRRMTNAVPEAPIDSFPPADKTAPAVGEPETEGLVSLGTVVAGTLLKPARKILQKATASAQRMQPEARRKKVLQMTATGPDAERDEGMASFCVPIYSASAKQCGRTSLVTRKKPLQHTPASSAVSCTEPSEHPAGSPALKIVSTACSGTLPSMVPQLTAAPSCPVPPLAANQAMNKHVEPQDKSTLLKAACTEVPCKASPTVSTTQAVPNSAAKVSEQSLQLVDTSTAKGFSSSRKLVPVVIVNAKGGTLKPLTGKLLTVGRLLKRPAARNKPAVTVSAATAGWPKKAKHMALPQQSVTADRQVSQSKTGCAGAARKLITENQPDTLSSLATLNTLGGVDRSLASDSSASLSKLWTQDHMAAGGQLRTPGRPLKRTVGTQTLLTRPRLRHLYQRFKTLQRKCLKLQTQKQQLLQELSSTRLEARQAQTFIRELRLTQFKEQVANGDARCLFLEEQLRCLGQTKHRWREETLQCCLMWQTLSPRGYRIISQSGLLSLPSCSTLKRHVDAVGSGAFTRGPPSPTGDTVPSIEDPGDDVLDIKNGTAGVTELGAVEGVDSASEARVTIGDKLDAFMRMAALSDARSMSGDQHGDGVDHFTKAFASVTCSEESVENSDQSLCMTGRPGVKTPAARRSHVERSVLGAESCAGHAGECVLQVVYEKPSDILDNVGKVTCTYPGTTVHLVAPTQLLPISAVDEHGIPEVPGAGVNEQVAEPTSSGGASYAEQVNVCPTLRSTVPSELLSSVAGGPPSAAVQESTSSGGVAGHCLWPKPPVSFPKPSKLPLEKDLLEQAVSPPRDLTELLNTVGASVSPSTTASAIGATVVGAAVENETQMLLAPTVGPCYKAVELPLLPVGQSPPASIQGCPGGNTQAFKVIYVDTPAVEGGQYEALNEMVTETLRVPGGGAGQVFEIVYMSAPAATENH